MNQRRRGDCPGCTHDIVDPRDLKFYRNVCGYWFEAADDRFRWRARLAIARAGWAELLVFAGSAIVMAIALGWWRPWAAVPPTVLALFVISFFRDPHREVPTDAGCVVSPADGTVTDVEEHADVEWMDGPVVKIGIFLSVFNVHVNRSPEAGRVIELRYFPGRFWDARRIEARQDNEQFWILLEGQEPPYRRFLVKQIAGAIARRIVCELRPGEVVLRGQRIGMIKFGSRTEIYMARQPGLDILIQPGVKVRGGQTVLARYVDVARIGG
jgi:phosphatidylserine decarboxylase